ncbi:MAG TPA: GDCCVxC domain-containing (seleno)protein [Candidatus Kapabacteria bacterium]|nr:GDCCVxC domain-containing (seleno)protein [Candidatus Kapabacteria bacterium]
MEQSKTSTITCPHCGHKKTEELPEKYCLIRYQCEECKQTLIPKYGDCCVFCTYGTEKCPSKQVCC